jgi:drug/metabolite transporter (DMT)-like permease
VWAFPALDQVLAESSCRVQAVRAVTGRDPGKHQNPAMVSAPASPPAISRSAFATLLLIALMMGANHVAARLAFNHGVDVATAVAFRSAITAAVVGGLVWFHGVPLRLGARHRRALPIIGLLVGVQSLCLYSSVARLPVALALLAFNTYPLWTALWARVVYGHRPEARVLRAMPVMLLGLALALDVLGAASGLGAAGQWARIGLGVAFALAAAATFGLALVVT